MEVSLQIRISADGKLESISHQPIVDDPKITESTTINHHCPLCFQGITLNILVHQSLNEEPKEDVEIMDLTCDSPQSLIKPEVDDHVEIKCDPYDDNMVWFDNGIAPLSPPKVKIEKEKPKNKREKKQEKRDRKKEFKCRSCESVFNKKSELSRHQQNCRTEDIVCHQCSDTPSFTKMTEFYNHVRIVHRSKFICHLCEPPVTFTSGFQYGPHMAAHKKKGYECERCKEKFVFRPEYLAHIEDYYKGSMECRLCESKTNFIHRSVFAEHLKTVHQHLTFPCPYCNDEREFKSESSLNHHMAGSHWLEKRFFCKFCKLRFETYEQKYAHRKVCPNKKVEVEVTCHYCGKICAARRKLLNHFRIVHKLPHAPFVCHFCGKEFGSHRHYDYHMERHIYGKQPYQCHHCSKRFQVKRSLHQHILQYHMSKESCDLLCDECDERFASMEILRRHKRRRHKKTADRVECDICGKSILNEYGLLVHKRKVHTFEGQAVSVKCDKCNYTTTNEKYLKIHALQHLDEVDKPFHCQYCGKGFINKSIGIRHEWTHTDTRPFKCTVCQKSFRHRADLTSHTRLHTGEKPYEASQMSQEIVEIN